MSTDRTPANGRKSDRTPGDVARPVGGAASQSERGGP